MRSRLAGIAGVVALALAAGPASTFGGEDLLWGRPWHHFDITARALAGDAAWDAFLAQGQNAARPDASTGYSPSSGFTMDAAIGVAWHADYIDSYLYSPFWWASASSYDVKTNGLAIGRTLGTPAYRASFLGFEDLARLHFDDIFTPAGLEAAWIRYASGTLAGLHWAASQDDPDAAQHILGISLHAVQDFYSHSNWVDLYPGRTWHSVPTEERSRQALYTGSYEISSPTPPHGTISPDCSKITAPGVRSVMATVCARFSPLNDSADCEEYRRCLTYETLPMTVGGVRAPNSRLPRPLNEAAAKISSGGIAYDNTLMTRLHRPNRSELRPSQATGVADPALCGRIINFGIECEHTPTSDRCFRTQGAGSARPCVSLETAQPADAEQAQAEALFAAVKDQAIASSIEWVAFIDREMQSTSPEVRAFWERVKRHRSPWSERRRQYEDASRLPYHFLSAGRYPTANPDHRQRSSTGYGSGVTPLSGEGDSAITDRQDGWFIRLEIQTADHDDAGTDANILAAFEGPGFSRTYLLDHLPRADPTGATNDLLWVYDDFKARQTTSYTAGPFPGRPTVVAITNDVATRTEVARAASHDISQSIDETLIDLRRSTAGILAGRRDYVGDKDSLHWASSMSADLDRAGPVGVERTLEIGGADNDAGHYALTHRIRRLPDNGNGLQRFEVELVRAVCLKQSRRDQLVTPSDEPFFMTAITPFGSPDARSSYLRTSPFRNVRSGEALDLGAISAGEKRQIVEIPPWSFFSIGAVVFEHDFDTAYDRRQLWLDYTTGFDETVRRGNARLLDELGRSVGAAWLPQSIKAYAFRRGETPEAGPVLAASWGEWMQADQSRRFELNYSGVGPLLRGSPRLSWRALGSNSLVRSELLQQAGPPLAGAAVEPSRPPIGIGP